MNNLKNNFNLTGRVGSDIELKNQQDKKAFTFFSLAIENSFKDKEGNYQNTTTWISVVAFEKVAENLSKAVKKGDLIIVGGNLNTMKNKETNYNELRCVANSFSVVLRNTPLKDKTISDEEPTSDRIEDDLPF